MGALSADQRQKMIAETHEVALDLLDDLQHVREIVSKTDPEASDIRRLSNQLRRILIEYGSDLRKVWAPRCDGRLRLLAPQLTPFHRSNEIAPYKFFSGGEAHAFGMVFARGQLDSPQNYPIRPEVLPDSTTLLPLDDFIAQRVVCFEGKWASRRDIITYIANVARGVHSGKPREPIHEFLQKFRYAATVNLKDDGTPIFSVAFDMQTLEKERVFFDRRSVDILLIQLISTAQYLTKSPDVLRLEDATKNEPTPGLLVPRVPRELG